MLNPENYHRINLGTFGKEAEEITDFGAFLMLLTKKGYSDLIKDQPEVAVSMHENKNRLIFLIGKATMDLVERRKNLGIQEDSQRIMYQVYHITGEFTVDEEKIDIICEGVVSGLEAAKVLPTIEANEK